MKKDNTVNLVKPLYGYLPPEAGDTLYDSLESLVAASWPVNGDVIYRIDRVTMGKIQLTKTQFVEDK